MRENPRHGGARGRGQQREWTFDRVIIFPRLGERIDNGGGQLSAASGGCSRSTRADDQPDLLILDEATEGLAPLMVRDLEGHPHHPRHRHICGGGGQEPLGGDCADQPSVILVKGEVVFDGPSDRCARTRLSKAPRGVMLIRGRARSGPVRVVRRLAAALRNPGPSSSIVRQHRRDRSPPRRSRQTRHLHGAHRR